MNSHNAQVKTRWTGAGSQMLVVLGSLVVTALVVIAFWYESLVLMLAGGALTGFAIGTLRGRKKTGWLPELEGYLDTLIAGCTGSSLPDGVQSVPEVVVQKLNTLSGVLEQRQARCKSLSNRVAGLGDSLTECAHASGSGVESSAGMITAAVSDLGSSVDEVAENAARAVAVSVQADQGAEEGKVAITNALGSMSLLSGELGNVRTAMQQLDGFIESIGSVLGVIRGIAEQTNMLALNAAIEAARAGEQGRGFAVVADEVRSLAARTQDSTREIQLMIERVQNGAQEVVGLVEEGDGQARICEELIENACISLAEIVGEISSIKEINNRIDALASGQHDVVSTLSGRLLASVDECSAPESAGLASLATELEEISTELQQLGH